MFGEQKMIARQIDTEFIFIIIFLRDYVMFDCTSEYILVFKMYIVTYNIPRAKTFLQFCTCQLISGV